MRSCTVARGFGIAFGLAVLMIAPACRKGTQPSASGLAVSGFPAEFPRPQYATMAIEVDGHPITVEVADTPEKRRYGCMFLSELPDDRGMIFVYPTPRRMGFWMRNTRIPLDILFLADDGAIVNAHMSMKPLSDTPSYPSAGPVRFALELPGGWLKKHGVWVRKRVTLPPELLQSSAVDDEVYLDNIPDLIGPKAGT